MFGYGADQSLRACVQDERGFTLVELFVALAMAGALTAVLASLFKAQVKSYTYSVRQTTVLANARQALDGGSSKPGMASQARAALSSGGLAATQLTLNMLGGSTSQYSLSGTTLLLTQSAQTTALAKNITSVQIAYYNMNASGLIMVSTQAASVGLVTAWIQSRETGGKTYTFYSGARLRNHL